MGRDSARQHVAPACGTDKSARLRRPPAKPPRRRRKAIRGRLLHPLPAPCAVARRSQRVCGGRSAPDRALTGRAFEVLPPTRVFAFFSDCPDPANPPTIRTRASAVVPRMRGRSERDRARIDLHKRAATGAQRRMARGEDGEAGRGSLCGGVAAVLPAAAAAVPICPFRTPAQHVAVPNRDPYTVIFSY